MSKKEFFMEYEQQNNDEISRQVLLKLLMHDSLLSGTESIILK